MPVNVQYIVRLGGHRMFAVLVCVSLGGGESLVREGGVRGRQRQIFVPAELCSTDWPLKKLTIDV